MMVCWEDKSEDQERKWLVMVAGAKKEEHWKGKKESKNEKQGREQQSCDKNENEGERTRNRKGEEVRFEARRRWKGRCDQVGG